MNLSQKTFTIMELLIIISIITLLEIFFITQYKKEKKQYTMKKHSVSHQEKGTPDIYKANTRIPSTQ